MNSRIRELRKSLGMSQTEFGDRLGIKQTTVAGYETGGRSPIDAVVSLICREFAVSEKWLRTGEGEIFLPQDEEIAVFMSQVLNDQHLDFRKQFVKALAKLDSEEWEFLDRITRKLFEELYAEKSEE